MAHLNVSDHQSKYHDQKKINWWFSLSVEKSYPCQPVLMGNIVTKVCKVVLNVWDWPGHKIMISCFMNKNCYMHILSNKCNFKSVWLILGTGQMSQMLVWCLVRWDPVTQRTIQQRKYLGWLMETITKGLNYKEDCTHWLISWNLIKMKLERAAWDDHRECHLLRGRKSYKEKSSLCLMLFPFSFSLT